MYNGWLLNISPSFSFTRTITVNTNDLWSFLWSSSLIQAMSWTNVPTNKQTNKPQHWFNMFSKNKEDVLWSKKSFSTFHKSTNALYSPSLVMTRQKLCPQSPNVTKCAYKHGPLLKTVHCTLIVFIINTNKGLKHPRPCLHFPVLVVSISGRVLVI